MKKQKSPRKKAVAKLDKVFSLYIRKRDKKCVICGATNNLQAGHLISRCQKSIRWDEGNVFAVCRTHNFLHEYKPEIMTLWYINKFGKDKYEDLVIRGYIIHKHTLEELEELIKFYEAKL